MTLDDLNYMNDPRVLNADEMRAVWERFNEDRMTITFSLFSDEEEEEEEEEEEVELELPARFAVCPTCSGRGTHVNPSIDAGGYAPDEDDYDDETGEDRYTRGDYNVTCWTCDGKRVVPELHRDLVDPKLLARVDAWEAAEDDFRALQLAERRAGA
jgi:hypothetical protein